MSKQFHFILMVLLATGLAWGQSDQKKLEAQRTALQKEIAQIDQLLFKQKKMRLDVADDIQDLNKKVKVREELISVTSRQVRALEQAIKDRKYRITLLEQELTSLKKDYAALIQQSYKQGLQKSRLLFLLSAADFNQAIKRYQYLKQYAQFRKKQGEEIIARTEEIARETAELEKEQAAKKILVDENTQARKTLLTEKNQLQNSLAEIKRNERSYQATMAAKKRQADALEDKIEELIRASIAANNAKNAPSKTTTGSAPATKKSAGASFVLTPEAKRVADGFSANKGKLIWPVERGVRKQGFGVYSDPVYPGIKHQSNGVIIATPPGSKARSIYEGEVIAILQVPGGKLGVQVKHGNYISTYYNLSEVYVKKGDRVREKQDLGLIHTSSLDGQSILKFYLYQNATRLNPQLWVYQL